MRRLIFTAAAFAWCLVTTGALAQSSDQRTLAEAFFQDGRRLLDEGKVAEACAKFGESQRIAPALGTLLNLAVCHEKQGKLASAWAEFTAVATQAARAGDADRKRFAAERLREIEPRVPKLVVSAEGVTPGMQIKLDGTSMGEGALGSSIPIDPGEHLIEVTAPDREPWSKTLQVAAGKQETLLIPRLEPAISNAATPAPAP